MLSANLSDIRYNHEKNHHTLNGAMRALEYLLDGKIIKSLLDVGAGNGTWLFAARQAKIADLLGVDGIAAENRHVWVEADLIKVMDLRLPLKLGKRFDAVLCLEVAEHLPKACAATLVQSLCLHGDLIFFSAAAPGQRGENHVNCEWPVYWQNIFNDFGFVCYDDLRLKLWNDPLIEPWYKQNIFTAALNPNLAGSEPRLPSLIHPEMIQCMDFPESPAVSEYARLREGFNRPTYYLKLFARSLGRRAIGGAANRSYEL
jgi:SAM-dependent methyltransferase